MDAYCTYDEIKSQAQAWAQAVERASRASLPQADGYAQTVFTGCGSTYYLSLAAAAVYQELTGRPARGVPASELWLNPQASLTSGKTLLVAVSRSGTTTETLQAVSRFRSEQRGDVLVISNYEEALSRLGDACIIVDKGQERSVAQTGSFASMLVASTALAARLAGRADLLAAMQQLPAAGERLLDGSEPAAKAFGEDLDFDRFYFLGSGSRYGLACEINLKMKEMTLTHSEAFHFMEYRHGPMSMVTAHTRVVGMLSDAQRSHEAKVLSQMQALGAHTWSLAESASDIEFKSGLPESVRGVLYLPALQLAAFYRALAKGLNPDRPNNLTAVVKLDS